MTCDEMIERMTSLELTKWWVLYQVRGEEAEHQRNVAESGDGQVVYYGRDEDDEDDEGDGQTE